MKNKFTENAEMQSGNPAELSDDELDSVSGGYDLKIVKESTAVVDCSKLSSARDSFILTPDKTKTDFNSTRSAKNFKTNSTKSKF